MGPSPQKWGSQKPLEVFQAFYLPIRFLETKRRRLMGGRKRCEVTGFPLERCSPVPFPPKQMVKQNSLPSIFVLWYWYPSWGEPLPVAGA